VYLWVSHNSSSKHCESICFCNGDAMWIEILNTVKWTSLVPRVNVEFVSEIHVSLHVSHTALTMATSKFRPTVALPKLPWKLRPPAVKTLVMFFPLLHNQTRVHFPSLYLLRANCTAWETLGTASNVTNTVWLVYPPLFGKTQSIQRLGYRLDDRRIKFRFSIPSRGQEIVPSPQHPDRLWGSPSQWVTSI
jgi:hypothetical protein